ncbi:MAG: UDP-N-acetylmuramate dehydrogenase [Clostridia bacterium]|nr:UDP-N-acetylmuramate dehydrogenase [Clostridia bacterium]
MTTPPERASEALHSMLRGTVSEGEPLARHTTIRIGGPARWFVEPADEDDLVRTLEWCHKHGVAYTVIGFGSNLLVPDSGFDGVVISLLKAANWARFDGATIEAGAGYPISRLVQEAARRGLAGLLGLAGIPGTVGGAVAMNAGTPYGEIKDVVESVRYLAPDGRIVEAAREEIRFRYRHSRFLEEPSIVLAARLKLEPADAAEQVRALRDYLARRNAAQPVEWPNTGSVWTNPPGDYAGRLIEEAGLKGARRGGAQISPKHANFIVNLGGASADDVIGLMAKARAEVLRRRGILLQPEVRWLEGQEVLERRLAEPPGG